MKKIITSIVNGLLDLNLRFILFKLKLIKQGKIDLSERQENALQSYFDQQDIGAIRDLPRYTKGSVNFLGNTLYYADMSSVLSMIHEIFISENYKFESTSKEPYIIDCGANIGISLIYFKKLYPKSQILAIEADPEICNILEKNIESFNIDRVKSINAAVWINDEMLNFHTEGSWGGFLIDSEIDREKGIGINGIELRKLLNRKVDLLKIDIEGAETEVIMHSRDKIIEYVDNLFFEWHSFSGKKQHLGEILSYFSDNGFRYHIKEASPRSSPFIEKRSTWRNDSQLDCFLYREKK